MTYGTMHDTTRKLIERRAAESNIELSKLGLEPDLNTWFDDEFQLKVGVELPANLYEISVIFGGALDEEFLVWTDYEVNIADWIAEQCREESEKQDDETWEILVSEWMPEDSGPVRYRTASPLLTGAPWYMD
jgi:hypothetical protein